MSKVGMRLILPVLTMLALGGCATQAGFSCPDGLQVVARFEMFFGLDHADGRSVSAEEWDGFLSDTITPRFPAGLSVLDVKGQWQRPDGVIERENTKLVMVVKPPPVSDGMKLVNEISQEYQQRFDQDPVFRTVSENKCVGLFVE